MAVADGLLAQLRALRGKAYSLFLKAEQAGDYRKALAGVREARGCLEVLLEVAGELDRRAQVKVLVAHPAIRAAILDALSMHPAARTAVLSALATAETGTIHAAR